MMEESRSANGLMCSAVVLQSLAGYALVSRQTRIRGFTPFDAAAGWSSWMTCATQVHANLAVSYPDESEELRFDRWVGLALDYPDQAVEDTIERERAGKDWQRLTDAELPATEHYGGSLPSFC